ncbi:uncharacterized protein [Chiloscyllium punctatum]|uniref:uncharacterized protein isoform X2 n=1 Tax=Chiloscyllium punctatum TaxID=137246 RepID=UPI003B635511
MWNLSLLSRGCGDLANRKHKRLDVYLEDQDYFNWKAPSKSACVSPKPHNSEDFLHHHCQPVPPKTFSTRRGALVLYSEDLALQSWQHQHSVKWRHRVRVQLSTLQDLARAILAYGQRENGAGSMQVEPYLHFLIGHRNRSGNRKIRPGYSAKQYLACLAETCDPTLLYRLQCSGYTNKLNQLQGQSVDSLLQQQTKCDLSKAPRPYRANPCLPVADLYQSWPCLDEEDKEEQGEETIFDTGESCPATDNEVKGTQSDSSRPGVREILTNRESGAEGSNPQETSLYVLVTVPARELEQITEEADQVQATQQVFNTPLTSSLNRQQPAKARDQCHSSNLPGRPIIDSSQLCCQRSRGTYYGGPLAGARRVKGRPGDQCGSRQHVEPPASVSGQLKLPSIGSETGAGLQPRQEGDSSELERWKLPQIQRRSLARGRHAGKRRKGPIPEAARFTRRLILPPIIDVRPQREKGEDIHNEATGKLGSPDSIEDSRMKGLDESTWINEEYPINTEEISVQNGGSVRISENNGQMESEERMVRFITIRIEENGTPLEGKLEASESQETFKMKGLDESTQMKEDYPISTEDRSSQDGGNVGISEKVTQKENEERDLKFIRIRIEENGDLLEGNEGLLEAPESAQNSRVEVLDQSTRINEEDANSTEERSGRNGGNVGISEKNSQREREEREVESNGIRIQENGNLLEGKLEASESQETFKMKGLDESTQMKEDYPISTEDRSSQDGGNVGISEKVTQKENEERDLKFIRIRIEENGDLLEGNKGLFEVPHSMQNSRVEALDQSTRINEEDGNSTEERSGRNGGNVGISEKEVESNGIRIQENGNLLEGGDDQSQKPGQTLQLLPPTHETRGPVGKRRSKPGLRHKARRTKTSSLGPVRGSVPKELKEVHKNISVGSLLMAPDGEFVHLSWLGPYQCPSNNLMISFFQQQGHRPLECDASGRKVGLITNQEPEGEEVNGAVHRDTKHLGDVHIETGDDIVFRSDRESGHSPGSYKRSQRGRARKAFRQGGRRRTDPDGDSSGKSESRSPGGGMKVNSHRRGRVKRQPSEDPSDLQDVVLDEDGNLTSAGSHRSPVSDPFLEGEVMRGRRRAARGSGYENSAAIPSLSGWSEPEPSSLSATDELEAMCGLHTVDDGRSPSRHRRSRLLLKDDHVVAVDSGTDAEDQEAELWNQQGKGNTGIKAKKKSKRNRGQNSPNQDPNAEDSDAMPSGSEELRSSRESNYGAALNKPPGPRRSLGLNKLSEARKLTDGDQESGPKGQPGPRGSLGPNNESNRNKGRAEFVVGRPREMRARQPQQRHPSQTKQKESSKPVTRKTVRGDGGEEDAEQSSEEGGPLHSTRTRNTPTSGSTLTAFTAGQDPNSQYNNTTMRDPEKDQENPGYPQGTTHLPGSRSLRRSGSSSLMEGGDWPQSQEEHSEQRQREVERRIQQELDNDQRQKEQEIRNQRQQRERAILQQREAEQNRQQQEQQSQRREQRQQEEYRRKVQEMQQRKERNLAERAEEEKRLQRERQKEQEEEEELLKTMNEPQRMEYLRLKQIKEEREKEEMEERRRKDGERSSILMQEAMQEAIFLLHQKGLMERDLTFSRNLWAEFLGLERDQNITRPWVFSYFELINFLGLQTPVEEGTEESSHVGQWD